MKITLEKIKNDISKFSDITFGITRCYTAPLFHMKKEIDECIESGDLDEYADMLLLLLDSYRKKHPDKKVDDLLKKCDDKIKICYQREWGDPDENGVIEHLK